MRTGISPSTMFLLIRLWTCARRGFTFVYSIEVCVDIRLKILHSIYDFTLAVCSLSSINPCAFLLSSLIWRQAREHSFACSKTFVELDGESHPCVMNDYYSDVELTSSEVLSSHRSIVIARRRVAERYQSWHVYKSFNDWINSFLLCRQLCHSSHPLPAGEMQLFVSILNRFLTHSSTNVKKGANISTEGHSSPHLVHQARK